MSVTVDLMDIIVAATAVIFLVGYGLAVLIVDRKDSK